MKDYIPLSVPSLDGNEWKYVKECIDTDWVSSAGKYVDLFEEEIANYTGAKYSVACVNGTSALQVSLRLAGVHPGDEVIVPTLTFIAPVNAITYNGATPIFIDSDNFYNIDIGKTIDFIKNETSFKNGYTYNKKTKCKITGIIPVHIWGNAVKIEELEPLCRDRNIKIIEDASESLGTIYNKGKYKNHSTGTLGTIGCLSFNGNKIITTGGGGMILTNNKDIAQKARYLTTQAKDDPLHYVHNEIGYNFRLTNIQSALGLAQLEQLPAFLKIKDSIYKTYLKGLSQIEGLSLAEVPNYAQNNHWMNVVQIDSNVFNKDRDSLMLHLEQNGIQTRPVWMLNHLQTPYKKCQSYFIEHAKYLISNSLCLPSSINLSLKQIKKIINIIDG